MNLLCTPKSIFLVGGLEVKFGNREQISRIPCLFAIKYIYLLQKIAALVRLGNSSIITENRDKLSLFNGGPHPSGQLLSRWITKRAGTQIMSFGVSSHHQCGFFYFAAQHLLGFFYTKEPTPLASGGIYLLTGYKRRFLLIEKLISINRKRLLYYYAPRGI